jgi:hypothetical protein
MLYILSNGGFFSCQAHTRYPAIAITATTPIPIPIVMGLDQSMFARKFVGIFLFLLTHLLSP